MSMLAKGTDCSAIVDNVGLTIRQFRVILRTEEFVSITDTYLQIVDKLFSLIVPH